MTTSTDSYAGRTKYDAQRAAKYKHKRPEKHTAEMRLIDRAFQLVPKSQTVLDAPCGTGRLTMHLAQAGYRVTAADLSEAMLAVTRETVGPAIPVERQDVEKFTYADRHFDTVVCFRLFHHFPSPEIRQRVVRELCRVAGQSVVLSYFAPALGTLKRKLREAKGGKLSKKYVTPLREVRGYFANAGFRLVKDFAQWPVVHTLHVAVFEREAA
jgi:ubiquinone/menaquinone biosynthesis C-methylase UbiE